MSEKRENGRILLVRREDKILTLLYANNRLLKADAYDPEEGVLNHIYIGKIKNIVQNIQAAFVEFLPGQLCFLSLADMKNPMIVNRRSPGKLAAGDEIVVQITSEKQKNKEAGGTTNLSFAGKYLVLSLEKRQIGYSPKLTGACRKKLREFWQSSPYFAGAGRDYGVIFRTNTGQLSDFTVLEEEIQRLEGEMKKVMQTAFCRTCYSCLREEPPAYLKGLLDIYSKDYEKILTDDAVLYEEARDYFTLYQKEDLEKLTFYEDALLPLSKLYSVESRLAEALNRKVWLKSGGYLVIDKTEALTCIDVNSGKVSGRKEKAETIFLLNMEAAQEIGIQLKLRNLSGIVIVDFINMESDEDNQALLKSFREILAKDAVKTNVVDMTALGLVELTRKKEKKSLWEQLKE